MQHVAIDLLGQHVALNRTLFYNSMQHCATSSENSYLLHQLPT